MSDIDDILHSLRNAEDAGRRRRFFAGLLLPFRAIAFLATHPSLWGWAVLPALINIAIFAIIAAALVFNVGTVLDGIWAQPDVSAWYHWLGLGMWYFVFALLIVGSLVVAYYLVLLVAGVVASPFADKLSRQTEEAMTGAISDARHGESEWIAVIRSAAVSLLRLALYLLGLAVLLPLYLVPAVGTLSYTVLATCWSALFLAVEYSNDTLDRRGLIFSHKLRTVRHNIDMAGGFGLGTSLLLVIPIVNLLAMPIAVVGGTALGLALRRDDESDRHGTSQS